MKSWCRRFMVVYLPSAVEQHQTDVDGVEDRLADPALVLDRLLAAAHPLRRRRPATSARHDRQHRGDDRCATG